MADVAVLALPVALGTSLVLTPVAAGVARRFGIVDRPGPLKVQREPVPYLGGLAVFVALAIPVAFDHAALLLPLALLALIGLADDVGELSPRLRLVAEIGAGLVAGGVAPVPGRFGVLVTAAFVVGLVNAVNLIDGLDGLAGGVAAASALGFAAVGGAEGRVLSLALAGALLGFLWWNRPPARIYLGDAGAYVTGGSLALGAAMALRAEHGAAVWAAVPLLVALPVFDTVVALVRRRRAGRPLFAGDRSHVYDQLVDRGQTRAQAVLECIALQAVLVAVGVLVFHLAAGWAIALAAVVLVALALLATRGGFVSRTADASGSELR